MNPGELNKRAKFYQTTSTVNQYLDAVSSESLMIDTWVKKEFVKVNNQYAIEAGASIMNEDCIFTIRERQGFKPSKSMSIECDGLRYGILSVYNPEKNPSYIRIVGQKKE